MIDDTTADPDTIRGVLFEHRYVRPEHSDKTKFLGVKNDLSAPGHSAVEARIAPDSNGR